jgi:PAS domain S-box-containing protein
MGYTKVRRRGALLLVTALAAGLVLAALGYSLSRSYMLGQVERRIRDVMLESRALHQYVQRNMHPALYKLKREGRLPAEFYAPELFSSSYIARNLHKHYNAERRAQGLPEVRYGIAATNPRNPLNRANSTERRLIDDFNRHPDKQEHRQVIEEDGKRYLLYARPFLKARPKCLKCHGKPEDAPKDLRDYYKWKGGYHYKVGEVVAVETIVSPLKGELSAANTVLAVLLGVVLLVLILLFVNWRLHWMVRRHTAALRASEAKHRETAELLPGVVFETDCDGRLTFVNQQAYDQFGYTVEDFQHGLTALDTIAPADRERAAQNIRRVMAGEEIGFTEYTAIRKDGTTFPVILHSNPIRHRGKPEGLRGILIDVTERKQLELELLRKQKLESIGRLAGGVAHDFNNMLTPIIGYAEMLAELHRAGDPEREDLEQIRLSAERAQDLTRQLLAFGRKQLLRLEAIDPAAAARRLAGMLRRTLREDIEVVLDLAEGTWAVRGDPTQLEEVLLNLAVNAQDAMPDGGTLVIASKNVVLEPEDLEVDQEIAAGDFVQLSVSDTGVGMSEATREHIFEPFFTTKEPGEGTGLGLAMVYGIVKQHGGSVVVESRPGVGTTFRVLFPRASGEVTEERPSREASLHVGDETVAVAEDDETVRRLAVKVLERHGYRVIAGNGVELLDLLARHDGSVDLLLTDVIMPGTDGRELYARLCEEHPELRVLYMSGYPDQVLSERGILQVDFIAKPFSVDALLARVREALGRPDGAAGGVTSAPPPTA